MRVLHWCVLAVTLLLLVCEVTVSQLCKSLITLVDGFHTLFIFMSVALPPPPPPLAASIIKPVSPSPDAPAPAGPPSAPLTASDTPAGTKAPVCAERSRGASSVADAPEAACGVSHGSSRVQPVGAFLSALLLASLCVSYLIQIISFSLDPHPVQHPLLLVLVGAVSLLHKTLLLRLNWDQLRVRVRKHPGAESHIEVNHRACEWPRPEDGPAAGGRRAACLLSLVLVTQGLLTPLLVLGHSLATLLSLHGAGTWGLLLYLDPALALLAVVTLIATVRPQMCRYGLMLLQAAPPHVSVSELQRRIASVPGVQAVHDLHIWQLAESLTVASAHVHCSATLPAHRCAELMAGVTEVLQSAGVSCCTVQPEFAQCSAASGGREGDGPPAVHREDSRPPAASACSLACGRACARSMCCSPHEEEASSPLAPPAGASEEEPQSLVIENTFL